MEDNISIFNDKNINQTNQNKKENFKKYEFTSKIKKIGFIGKNSIFNFILYEIISVSLLKTIFSQRHMKIKFNKIGYNQIFSDYYNDVLPFKALLNHQNGLPISMINKKVLVESKSDTIYLEWPSSTTKINASYMFSNLTTITSVSMNIYISGNNISYMFYNCKNLEYFTYNLGYSSNYMIRDMSYMFYNCYSLKSFNFTNFYLDYSHKLYFDTYFDGISQQNITIYNYTYDEVNLSYMFYNCNNLTSITFGSYDIGEVIDMKGMFYNCFSLTSIDLTRILTNNQDVDLSYMFYNCSNLKNIERSRTTSDIGGEDSNNIYIKDILYMFYDCTSITTIYINYFNGNNYLNMSKLFYNCNTLTEIIGNFSTLQIKDTREMFYNCYKLASLTFNPLGINNYTNMTKMFYNCKSLESLVLNAGDYFFPTDLSYAFYNCINLESLTFKYFKTDHLKNIIYMMFNCKALVNFLLDNSNFSNLLIKNMRGVFQNCEKISSINLYSFKTPHVEIMWDMFKGCRNLKSLKQKFDTSNVVDMESMFEECSSLTSLNLSNFRTTKVHYMNKMFCNCTNLETLDFRYITSEDLGTMQKMFYNCKKLQYLNVFSLTEKSQSIYEIFNGTSNNFVLCVEENENIPKIFQEYIIHSNITRDCSNNCYGPNTTRVSINEKKLCCPHYEYGGECYDKCPPRTKPQENHRCATFLCEGKYYNYEQTGCIDVVPNGYYINNISLRTIDKCPKNCVTCEKTENQDYVHCLTCVSSLPFLYFGNCLEQCEKGFYNNSGILTCKCSAVQCSECSEKSIAIGKCTKCAQNYYPISTEQNNPYKNCYKDPPKYYLNSTTKMYDECQPPCQFCFGHGTITQHECSSCDADHGFFIEKNISGIVSKNCFENCTYHYYFDENQNFIYKCTDSKECPYPYIYLVVNLGECVKDCSFTEYKMQLKRECYKECPAGISQKSSIKDNFCDTICPYDSPFELILDQTCVASCSIIERSEKLCITNNVGNRTNLQIQEIIHDDIISNLNNNFNYTIITDNYSILINETETLYEIISTNNQNQINLTSNIDFGKCETILKEYYDIPPDEPLIVLKMDAKIAGQMGPTVVYELFYPSEDKKNLQQLDISICEGEKISISYSLELTNPELYDKNNPIYNDICHPYTSEDGLDMTLSSKQQDYANNNKSLCEENCEYIGYDKIKKLVQCNCDVKDTSSMISAIKVDKSKLYDFMGISKLANFDVLKCVNLIVQKEYLIANIGFYAFIPSFICYFFAVIIFYAKDFNSIKIKINNLVIAKKNLEYLRDRKKKFIEDEINKRKDKYVPPVFLQFMRKKKMFDSNTDTSDINIYNVENDKLITNEKSSTKLKQNDTIEEKVTEEEIPQDNSAVRLKPPNNTIINVNNIHNDIVIIKNGTNNANPPKTTGSGHKSKKNKVSEDVNFLNLNADFRIKMEHIEKEENKMKVFLKKNDKELNDLDFKSAVKNDNRTFGRMYFSFLKAEHLIIRIINKKDYNSLIVKLYLFLYNAGLAYTVNGLFFDDEAIEQIFADGGQFNFINQIPQIIYSSIISFILFSFLDYLALTEDTVLDIKKSKVAKVAEKKANDTIRTLKIKYAFFFILSFFFMLACWYYMTCFCAVYRNTQFHLLKDTLISFGISMLSPLLTKLVPTFFRVYGLRKRSHIIFRIGEFSQMLL